MTQLVTSLGEDLIDKAFKAVLIIPKSDARPGGNLYKLQLSEPTAAAAEAWAKIKDLLKDAARAGWDAVKSKADGVLQFIEDQAQRLGEWAEDFRQLILTKIHELMQETYDLILGSFRPQIGIGGSTYVLNSFELNCKLVFSGSIEGSLTTLCKFVASGETAITGTYTLHLDPVIPPTELSEKGA
jgi:hypothetical protein